MCPASRGKIDLSAAADRDRLRLRQEESSSPERRAGRTAHGRTCATSSSRGRSAFPKATTMRSQPAIVGSTLFLPVPDSRAAVRDRHRRAAVRAAGCTRTKCRCARARRTASCRARSARCSCSAISRANVHMVDATTGEQIWVAGRSASIRCRSRRARRCCTRIASTCRSRSTRSRSAATTITSAARATAR